MNINDTKIAIIFDNIARPDTTGMYFSIGLERLGYRVDHYNSNCYLDNTIPDGYDIYLCIDDGFDKNMPIKKYKSGISAFYAIDTHLTFKDKLLKSKQYDVVFCAQRDGAKRMIEHGVNAYWVPLGFDEIVHKKYKLEKIYDLAFVGNIDVMKERAILAARYVNKYKIFIGKAPFYELSKIYSQSRIVLNWSIKNDINMRFFEALGSGSCLLSKKVRNGENQFVREKIHYVSFSNWWDLDRKIAYYLKNCAKREKIAKKGYELAISKFTYINRVNSILTVIDNQKRNINIENDDYHPERLALLPYCVGKGIDVGCGHRKTSLNCIGVDILAKNTIGKYGCVAGKRSQADITASGDDLYMFNDEELDFVISRHNLEHYVDVVKTIQEWKRVLKKGGILGVILPDESNLNTIALDSTHKHAFTPESYRRILELIGGFEVINVKSVIPNWSFLYVSKKI